MDMKPGKRCIIIAAFISVFLDRNRSLDSVYATDTTKKVEIRQLTTATISVFSIICGKLNTEKSVNSLT